MDEPLEVYLLSGHSRRCILCEPSAEKLVGGLYGDGFTLCPEHILRVRAVAMDEAGERILRAIERTDA